MKKVFIEKNLQYSRILELDNENEIKLCLIEREDLTPKIGDIYLGVIENIAPRISGYFVNIGKDKNCFMPYGKAHKKFNVGEYVAVEILREELDKKGAIATSKFSLGGSNLVLTFGSGKVFYSKKIKNKEFIKNTKALIKEKNLDIVYRGNSQYLTKEEILDEYGELKFKFTEIISRSKFSNNKGIIYKSQGILKEFFSNINFSKNYNILVNNNEIFKYILSYKEKLSDEYKNNFYVERLDIENLFEKFSLEDKILKLVRRKVDLPLGENILIDRTEAMTVIDVNSGMDKLNKTNISHLDVNIESAHYIAKEIIKRNISGIIVVDFINLKLKEEREKVLKELRQQLGKDRNKTKVYDFTELNIVQITRERRGKSIYEYLIQSYNNNFIKYDKLDFEYILFYIKNKIKYIIENKEFLDICIELPKYYELDIMRNQEFVFKYLYNGACSIYMDFKEDIDNINIKKLSLNKDKKLIQKLKNPM